MIEQKAIAVVGLGAVLPDAFDAATFWKNIREGRYSITDVPANRWNPELYFDNDPSAMDKTYSKIGAWVNGFTFDPLKAGIAIPPRVLAVMDDAQKWAIAAARQALSDYGYPERSLNSERVAVILGNAMAGEFHYRTNLRIQLPEILDVLSALPEFQTLPHDVQQGLLGGVLKGMHKRIPEITEDTMPGELSNIIAGRVANVFNLGGPNFVTDAACASSLAALQSAVDGLVSHKFDAVLTGGVDRNMGVDSFVKFSKIGALSPDGSRPYSEGANGFVMGEGAVLFLLKRLEDAERDGDKIYAVVRGIGSSSDGKGKGITAPNPIGQERAIERAWKDAGISPATIGLIEGHGTSTKVGDVVEVNSLTTIFGGLGLETGSVALGSVKSNIGHLKSAAGAAGMLKVVMALHEKMLPPSINFTRPNPALDFGRLPFAVNTTLRPWEARHGDARRAGLSSFGFGGTNFHVVMEEYVPGLNQPGAKPFQGVSVAAAPAPEAAAVQTPYRGVLFIGAQDAETLRMNLNQVVQRAQSGELPEARLPSDEKIRMPQRLAIDFGSAEELIKRGEKALKAMDNESAAGWQAMTAQGVFRGSGTAGKLAFLFPGQGSQYVNMLKDLVDVEPAAAETVKEADAIMAPILGRPLTDYIYVNGDEESLKRAETDLKNTAITQPAVLTANVALLRVLKKFGIQPEMVIGHSLGEYAALVAAGVLTFAEALEVVSARGREMARVSMSDNGCMAAVSAPLAEVERILKSIPGYVVLANINSPLQSVIGGETAAVDAAVAAFMAAGFQAVKIPVSHAFHTRIVEPASGPLKQVIRRMQVKGPQIPVAANVTGELYPSAPEAIVELLGKQVASPVQFIRGIETLYEQGVRVFVEVGPKRVLNALATDILKERGDVTILATNHPRKGAVVSLNEALCGLFAAGIGSQAAKAEPAAVAITETGTAVVESQPSARAAAELILRPGGLTGSVVISGAGLGLPGKGRPVFDDSNVQQILRGESRIDALDDEKRQAMVEKRVTRLVKSEAGAVMETIDDPGQTVKLAGQAGEFDLARDFGINGDRVDATDISTQLAMAAGVEALRDAGIPLVMRYKPTSTGSFLPNRWMLPEALADETGVIFGSAFPGMERMADEADKYYRYEGLLRQVNELRALKNALKGTDTDAKKLLTERIEELNGELVAQDYHFDRRFIFRILAMGHSQFAEYIGARGPNTSVNAACATTTHALALAEDWIRAGRCRRVVIIAGDDVTDGKLVAWIGSGLLASGATTTEGDLRKAALPFDRRRNGMIMGMGAAALVVESEDAVRERGMRGITEVLSTQIGNSAFHGTRLDVSHVSEVMGRLVGQAESRFGLRREDMAEAMIFVSHETYTPARGGSAAAEIHALRKTFAEKANRVVIANTKGFTGHTMGVGIEDVVAVKALEFQQVPPIAHLDEDFEPDPELGDLNLSHGGTYPVRYALRLGAGFGSQIAMSLLRKIEGAPERVNKEIYQRWLAAVAGYAQAEIEVEQRTLRIRDAGVPVVKPAVSSWQYGDGPLLWAENKPVAAAADSAVPMAETPKAAAVGAGESDVRQFVLGLVSEKTGYPVEMLDPALDLEADLGVDTVKQAELFAAVREHYSIPRREDLRLAEYNTLEKVVGFVLEAQNVSGAVGEPIQSADMNAVVETVVGTRLEPEMMPAPEVDLVRQFVLGLVSEKTGYPVEMLDPALDLEADLGVDTVKQAELFAAVREHYSIARREDLRLADYNTLEKVVGFVLEAQNASPAAVEPTPSAHVEPVGAAEVEPGSNPEMPEVDGVRQFVLALVSEKTGYPVEMLDPALDLEADLGIDTVKQAELFAAVREHYGIARREDLRLVEFNTLEKVVGFVLDSTAAVTAAEVVEAENEFFEMVEDVVQPLLSVQRSVVVPVLRPKADLCISTGVQPGAGSRVLIIGNPNGLGDALARKLRSRKAKVEIVEGESAVEAVKTMGETLAGVYFLNSAVKNDSLNAVSADAWRKAQDEGIYHLAGVAKSLPSTAFLICAVRLDGLMGYGDACGDPLGGLICGFGKALKRERPGSLVKVVDLGQEGLAAREADWLIEETLFDPAVVEIGRSAAMRFSPVVEHQQIGGEVVAPLSEGDVFVISGGSGGIIAPVALELAQKTRGHFYLLGRTPLPDVNDPDLVLLRNNRPALMQTIAARIIASGLKAIPAEVERKIAGLERGAAVLDLIQQIEKLGGTAASLTCDVTSAEETRTALETVIKREGRIACVLHAAGVERSRKLENKTDEEFRQIVSVKVDGLFNLLRGLSAVNALPGRLVLFSSVAGRFGNAGQTDYSAGNDLLVKAAASLNLLYPEMQTLTIDWGAWGEVGMASRGHMPALMKRAGIELMNPKEAARALRMELERGTRGEVMLAGSLGALADAQGGALDVDQANAALVAGEPLHRMLSRLTGMNSQGEISLEAELDPQREVFLKDHALNGIPILPGVMGIEGFTVAAKHVASVLGSAGDGFEVARLEDIQFLAPFKFYRGEARRITWKARVHKTRDGLEAKVSLESTVARFGRGEEVMQHFSGRVLLEPARRAGSTGKVTPPHWNGHKTVRAEEIYKLYFHGPAFQVLDGVQRSGGGVLGRLNKNLPGMDDNGTGTLSRPMLVELCLQTAGVWEAGRTGVLALPQSIGELVFHSGQVNGVAVFADVQARVDDDGKMHFDARVVDEKGRLFVELKNYQTSPLPYSTDEKLIEPLRVLMQDA